MVARRFTCKLLQFRELIIVAFRSTKVPRTPAPRTLVSPNKRQPLFSVRCLPLKPGPTPTLRQHPMQSSRGEKWRRLLLNPGLWVFIVVTVAGIFALRMVSLSGGLESTRLWLGALAPLLTIPLHIMISISPIPSDFICVGNGAFYGFWGGAACSWCGWWLAGMICFWIGRRLSIDLVTNAAERLPRLLRRYP